VFAARAHGARELAEARDVSHTHTSYTFELLNVMRYSFVMRVIILYSFKAREYLPIYCMLYERFTDFPDALTVIFFQNKIMETVTLVVIYDYIGIIIVTILLPLPKIVIVHGYLFYYKPKKGKYDGNEIELGSG